MREQQACIPPIQGILVLTTSKRGSRNDKRLADQRRVIETIPTQVSVVTDTAFQGGYGF